jgi:tetratricopeptide (TPR) repeat protein
MEAFVRESLAPGASPRLKLLAGFAPYSRALKLRDDARPVEAMAELNAALKAGDLWRVYLVRANIAHNLGQNAEALADLDRAFELKPQAAPLADYRGSLRARLGMLEGAVADFDLALRLDPSRPRPAEAARLADELVRRSNAAMAGGGTERAEALRTLANNLKIASAAPGAPTPAAEASPTVPAYADPAAAFQGQLAALPDDYAAYRRAAIPLLNAHRADQLDELWTAWIQRHPDDARGYFGRYAADSQKHDVARGDEDLRQACALGLADACHTQEINAAVRGRAAGSP